MLLRVSDRMGKDRSFFGESGIALFLVLWVLALLSVIVGEFCFAMRTEVNITRNFKEGTQAYYIAEAGLNIAVIELLKNGLMPREAELSYSEDDENEVVWRINIDMPPISFAQGQFKVRVENESGKININRAGSGLLRMMLNGFDLEDADKDVIVDSILDWRDKDHFHRVNGAEDDYYLSLQEPYECKDDRFDSIKELMLVKGLTSEMFYGGLRERVSVYKEKGIKKGFDFNRININAASAGVLGILPMMTEDLILAIMDYRKEKDFRSMSDLTLVIGTEAYAAISRFITLENCPYYTVKSVGMVEGSRTQQGLEVLVRIDAGEKRGYRIIRWIEN